MAHNSYETVAVKSDEKHKGGSGYGKVALGAAAGLAGGALLAHEGHKVRKYNPAQTLLVQSSSMIRRTLGRGQVSSRGEIFSPVRRRPRRL